MTEAVIYPPVCPRVYGSVYRRRSCRDSETGGGGFDGADAAGASRGELSSSRAALPSRGGRRCRDEARRAAILRAFRVHAPGSWSTADVPDQLQRVPAQRGGLFSVFFFFFTPLF